MTVTDLVRTADPLTASATLRAIQTVRSTIAPDLNDDELRLFSMVATRSGLDVFARQIYAIKRKGRVTFQTSIDGYRSIASRTGLYDGQDGTIYGPDCSCGLKAGGTFFTHPAWAEVWVYRKEVDRPFIGHSDWHETAPDSLGDAGAIMWRTKPRLMIAKCAEAQGLRRAFPWDGVAGTGIPTGVYTADEVRAGDDADEATEAPATGRAAVAARAQRIRAVEASEEAVEEDPGGPLEVEAEGEPGVCGAIGEGELEQGAVCMLDAGHPGPHSNGTDLSWPARRG